MSQEAVPEREAARETSVPEEQGPPGPPKGLLQQMEELMAALSADLTQLDADLQQPTPDDDTAPPAPRPSGGDGPTRF